MFELGSGKWGLAGLVAGLLIFKLGEERVGIAGARALSGVKLDQGFQIPQGFPVGHRLCRQWTEELWPCPFRANFSLQADFAQCLDQRASEICRRMLDPKPPSTLKPTSQPGMES